MGYWIFGCDTRTKQPRDPLYLEAANEEAARYLASEAGMEVEFISRAGNPKLSPEDLEKINAFPLWRTIVGWTLKLVGLGVACLGFLVWIFAQTPKEMLRTLIVGGCLFALSWFIGTPAPLRRIQ